jgi:hypothetical protein
VHWAGEVVTSRRALRDLVASRCEAAAFMRFARAPWATPSAAGASGSEQNWVIGDLRYDREPSLSFAEFNLVPQLQRCPQHVPPWLPPRGDILGESLDR